MADQSGVRCILCGDELGEDNDSSEHVIPNAIGGRKEVRGLLCEDCNNDAGATWERAVAEQFRQLCVFFDIERDRGSIRPEEFETEQGERVLLDPEGELRLPEPQVEKEETSEGVRVRINAPDEETAREIAEGFAQKYGADIEEALEGMDSEAFDPGRVSVGVPQGGLDFGRSVVKMPLALIRSVGKDPHECEKALSFLHEGDAEPCFGYYYDKDLVVNRPEGVPFHCVHVEVNQEEGLIVAYVELFGYLRMVMGLSTSYSGEPYTATYALDPRSGDEVDLDVDLDVTEEDIRETYEYENYDPEVLKEALEGVMVPAVRRINEKARDQVVDEAVRYAFENCGAEEGATLTDQQFERFRELVLERLEPWIIQQLENRRID